jgi:hypothetical protein
MFVVGSTTMRAIGTYFRHGVRGICELLTPNASSASVLRSGARVCQTRPALVKYDYPAENRTLISGIAARYRHVAVEHAH